VEAFWPTFIKRFPSWKALADATPREVEDVLRPIGLAKQRAPRLHALGTIMAARKGRFPECREEIESLPGVGQYIANAVFTFGHGISQPLLDVNMARVLERYFGTRQLADIRYDPYLQSLGRSVVRYRDPVSVNWAILDLAALICTPRRPLCTKCPVARGCKYARDKDNWGQATFNDR
jgi:A/G-specific adenine glycosylase